MKQLTAQMSLPVVRHTVNHEAASSISVPQPADRLPHAVRRHSGTRTPGAGPMFICGTRCPGSEHIGVGLLRFVHNSATSPQLQENGAGSIYEKYSRLSETFSLSGTIHSATPRFLLAPDDTAGRLRQFGALGIAPASDAAGRFARESGACAAGRPRGTAPSTGR